MSEIMEKTTKTDLISSGFKFNDKNNIEYNGDLCIIDFYADWCMPCKNLEKTLNDIKNEINLKIFKINVEDEFELAEIFSIKNLPTIIICNKNKYNKLIGNYNKEKLLEEIKKINN